MEALHEIQLPISKSIANRYLILAALGGAAPIALPPDDALPNDVRVMRSLLSQSGTHEYDVQDAGTVFRFITAYTTLLPGTHRVYGTPKLNQRPIAPLVDALKQIGARIAYESKPDEAPLIIEGHAPEGGNIITDASVSSQFVSALMLIAPALKYGITIHLQGRVSSWPYITLTQKCLHDFGLHADMSQTLIRIPPQKISACTAPVEKDWSSAAFWYALCAVTGKSFRFPGLHADSVQADAKTPHFFSALGVATHTSDIGIEIHKSEPVDSHLAFDMTEQPDMAPALIVACAALRLKATFSGLHTLKFKESDRTKALEQELSRLDVHFTSNEGTWALDASALHLCDATLLTYNDHRLAMAFHCFKAMHAGIGIENPGCMVKSYPQFLDQFNTVFLN